MNRFYFILLLIPLISLAQPTTRIDSLPPKGILLDQGWKWHAGDNPVWANPAFNDSRWVAIDPTKDIMKFPQIRRAGIGWFRIHLAIHPSVLTGALALLVAQTGASEIYLNGRQIYRFGQIGKDGQALRTYTPWGVPMSFPVRSDTLQTLAIRFACANNLVYTTSFITNNPLLRIQINDVTQAVRYHHIHHLSGMPLDYAKFGIFFILAILHLSLYLYYPIQRANLYFSLFSLCSMLTYFLQTQVILPQSVETSQAVAIIIGILTNLFHLLQLAALYSLFDRPFGRVYRLLTVLFLVSIPLTVWPYRLGLDIGHNLYYLACFVASIRITWLAVRQKQRGSTIIMRGVIVALLFTSLYSLTLPLSLGAWSLDQLFLTGNPLYYLYRHLPYNIAYLSIPIAISLYLGLEFAFTNKTLAAKLIEVEDLSAQTRAQEAEKLKLVAEQNEQLERTVRERTHQLQRQTDKLQELDTFKSRFFTNLTHEFRTPLTLILGPTEQLLARQADDQTKQQVGLIQRNAQRLLRLINQLLDLSKLEAGKMSLTTAPGDLVSLVRGTLQSFESTAAQKAIGLHFTTTQPRLMRQFDRDKLEKILYNLLANALKFTPTGGTVSVSLTDDDPLAEGWVQLRVQDTGVGIPAVKQPYIFDRFYQADASDTREQEGTGIGLALTKELVELHRGTIQLSSQEGTGTLVVVQLPLQAVSSPGEAAEQPILPDRPLNPVVEKLSESESAPLVLLIEDNDDVRAFIRSSLSGSAVVAPYRIIEAPNGEVGVRLAQQQVPDLVITDLMMPKLDGYQVCTALKQDERTSHIPVIMLTARADLESKLEGLETGADVYLAKPFSQRELVAHLTNLIALRRQLQQRYSGATFGRATLGQNTSGQHTGWPTNLPVLPSMEQVFLDRVRAAIEDHLDDEQYSVERLSDEVGLSRTQLHRKLKALTDEAPGDLIRALRLQRAHELLGANVGTVAEVAYQVGFGNPANFSTSFSRQFGYAPSEVRKKVGN